jgi:hypothetical protein
MSAESTDCGSVVTELATMPPDSHLDVDALARILGRHKKTVQRSVRRGELPRPFKLLGRSTWTARTIVAHLAELQARALAGQKQHEHRIAAQGA